MKTLIKNAMICVSDNTCVPQDILFDENEILALDEHIEATADEIIDAQGKLLMSGLIDVHVHLREPGFEQKETIAAGTMAAAHGGFTTIMAMPNVSPVPDSVNIMQNYQKYINERAHVRVCPYASITKGEKGSEVVDFKALKQLGIHAFSDDGVGVANDEVMREAMKASAEEDILIVAHTEDMNYRKAKACIHEGIQSEKLQVIGIPSACEYEQVKRDLQLVEETNAHYHICHMSTKESVAYLKEAKRKGLDVSGEVTVHHLLLNELDVKSDANYKMNPPLRSISDQEALLEGLKSGVIDLIANDHAPHTAAEKAKGLVDAPFGIVSLETAFPLLYTYLVKQGKLTLQKLLECMSSNPAKRFGMDKMGQLKVGYIPDLVLVDLSEQQKINPDQFYSKGKNTPFCDWKISGIIKKTFVQGKLVYEEER